MSKIINTLKQPNIGAGYLYFYIHFVTEVLCFYVLSRLVGDAGFLWVCPLIYDSLAFVPQSLIGYISDLYSKINFGIIGTFLLVLGLITFELNLLPGSFTEIIILCLGNACIHINGAEVTLRSSNGKLSHSAIFVSGGSFGVITGKLLSRSHISLNLLSLFGLTMIPFILLAEYYRKENSSNQSCQNFNYHNPKINPKIIILLAIIIVIVRGYMGYGLPTSWNKTTIQTILLYCTMGLGKAFGGILTDAFGMRKIALLSMLLALPYLLVGDNFMIISLIGIFLFSMTMSITLGLLVSTLKNNPGLAFGLTTIGLFLGTLPIFFIQITNPVLNCLVITFLTFICIYIATIIIRKDDYCVKY